MVLLPPVILGSVAFHNLYEPIPYWQWGLIMTVGLPIDKVISMARTFLELIQAAKKLEK